jgi:hypothetical protein
MRAAVPMLKLEQPDTGIHSYHVSPQATQFQFTPCRCEKIPESLYSHLSPLSRLCGVWCLPGELVTGRLLQA